MLLADLVGVAVFAASGASAGVAKRLDLFGVIFVGFVAALGGGIIRDLVIDVVPPLAFADWRYPVVAAVVATATVVALERADLPHNVVLLVPATLIFGVRLLGLRRKWSAPRAVPGEV